MENLEPKPEWSTVPSALKSAIERVLGARVLEGSIQWGGFTPSANFRLQISDNRTVFCKAVHAGQTDIGRMAFAEEHRLFREVPAIHEFAPRFLGAAAAPDGWEALLFEYITDRLDVPPWTDELADAALKQLARLHTRPTDGLNVRRFEDSPFNANLLFGREGWGEIRTDVLKNDFAALFPAPAKARAWLDQHLPNLQAAETSAHACAWTGRALIHVDLRSDNILFSKSRGPLFVDWPYLTVGPPILDLSFFLPSLIGESKISGSQLLKRYEAHWGQSATREETRAAACLTAGFFAARAHLPGIPALPRLRWIQQLQLFPAVAWMCEVMDIESPV